MARQLVRMSLEARAWYLPEICYLADHNPVAAGRVAEMMRTARINLSEHPEIGRVGSIPGTRRLLVGPYIVTTQLCGGIDP